MTDQKNFEDLSPKLMALEKKEIRNPDMPVDQAVKEGEIMAAAATQDAMTLGSVGISAEIIAELGAATSCLRFAEAKLTSELGELKEASQEWVAQEPIAIELRGDILAAVAYAVRDIPNAVKAVRHIREGSGSADMIEDLAALVEVGKKYINQLKAINFDITRLDTAAEMAHALSQTYAKAFLEKGVREAKEMRDRAFTYMRKKMSQILDAAEYVFRKNTTRLDYYYSSYRSRQKSQSDAAPSAS